MHGPVQRLIQNQGREYTVRNAARSGARDAPNYSGDDGTLDGVLEQRQIPTEVETSAGETVQSNLEIRAVPGDAVTIHEPGEDDWHATKLDHPNGQTYQVIDVYPEDSGVKVLTVVRD